MTRAHVEYSRAQSLVAPLASGTAPRKRARRAVLAIGIAGATLTGALTVTPLPAIAQHDPQMSIVLETAVILIAAFIGLHSWRRYRLGRSFMDILLIGAVTFTWLFQPVWAGLASAIAGPAAGVWSHILARLAAAAALAVASYWPAQGPAVLTSRGGPTDRWLRVLATAALFAAASTAVLAGAAVLGASRLPDPSTVDIAAAAFGRWPAFESVELATALGFSLAAWGFARRADAAPDDGFLAWTGFGCAFCALSSVNYAIFPSGTDGWLYTGDYFLLAGVLAWGIAGYKGISCYQDEITSLARVEERRRVARDLHDGLAQDLAYLNSRAKLLLGTAAPDRAALSDIAATSERALHESRRAVLTLTRPISGPLDEDLERRAVLMLPSEGQVLDLREGRVPGPLDEDLARTAREAACGYATQVHVSVPPGLAVGSERHEAMVCIVREAVRNASRHGGAASAAVEVTASGRGLALRVHDDGSGFDPALVRQSAGGSLEGGFGLVSMDERCRAAGARFKISSAPGLGTTIEVKWL